MRCHHQSSPSMKTQGLCSLFSVLSSSERETLFLNCDDQIEVSNCITFSLLSPSLCLSVFHPPFVCILYFIFDTLKSSSFEDLKSSFFLPPREKKKKKKKRKKFYSYQSKDFSSIVSFRLSTNNRLLQYTCSNQVHNLNFTLSFYLLRHYPTGDRQKKEESILTFPSWFFEATSELS